MTVIIIAIVASICALLFAIYLARQVMAHDTGTDVMRSIAAAIPLIVTIWFKLMVHSWRIFQSAAAMIGAAKKGFARC